jgi:hypothetical protein
MTVRGAALVAVVGAVLATAVPAAADPAPPIPGSPVAPAADAPAEPAEANVVPVAATDPGAPPVDDGKVVSSPPATTKSPDGWTLTLSAKDEMQRPVAPLTTAISTREYEVGGVFTGKLSGGDDTPGGVFEVGYQIGCGIDMSTSNGVSLTGTAGINPSIGYFGLDFPGVLPDGIVPGIGANVSGAVTVGLKPGIINTVPVTKKKFESAPSVGIDQRLPDQDRRLCGGIVHPLLCHPGQVDQGRRRDPVLVRRHQEGLTPEPLRESLVAAFLVAEHAHPEGVDAGEAGGNRFAVDVAGDQPVGQQARYRLVDIAGGERDGVAAGRGDLLGQLGGGDAGQAGGAQTGLGGVQRKAAVLVLQSHHVAGRQRGVGGVVAL